MLSEIFKGSFLTEDTQKISDYLKVGDYVDYDATKSDVNKTQNVDVTLLRYESPLGSGALHGNGYGTQTYEAISTIKWRVLNISDEKVELVSDNIITKKEDDNSGNFVLKGAIGYLYAEQELNEICKIFGYGYGADTSLSHSFAIGGPLDTSTRTITGTGARSIKIEDVNKYAALFEEEDFKALDSDYGNTDNPITNVYYPTTSTTNGQSNSAGVKNLKYTDYIYGKSKITDVNIQNVLFDSSYWFASRSNLNNNVVNNGVRFLETGGMMGDLISGYNLCMGKVDGISEYLANRYGVRPIVTIKSNFIDVSNVTDDSGSDASHAWKLK